jgi:hypothetical protein
VLKIQAFPPAIDLGASYAVVLPSVTLEAVDDLSAPPGSFKSMRGVVMFTVAGGVASASTTGGSESNKGPVGQLAIAAFPPTRYVGGGFRLSGGYAHHGLIDMDAFGGVGFHLGWLSLAAVSGLGLDLSTSNPEARGPMPNDFAIPVGAYWQYGARAAYHASFGSFELMYTKAFRSSDHLYVEKRADVRITVAPIAVTLRYVEYRKLVDSLLGTFSSDRDARLFWILAGVGF